MFLPIIDHGNGPLYTADFLPFSPLGYGILWSLMLHKRYLFAVFLKNELIHLFWFFLWLHGFVLWTSFSTCHKFDPFLQLAKVLCDFSILIFQCYLFCLWRNFLIIQCFIAPLAWLYHFQYIFWEMRFGSHCFHFCFQPFTYFLCFDLQV